MTTNSSRTDARRTRPTWKAILIEMLMPHRGMTVPLDLVYAIAANHAAIKERYRAARDNTRAKLRQQLQVLRDEGLIEWEARGRWRIPPEFPAPRT